jgi:hypothetical protein
MSRPPGHRFRPERVRQFHPGNTPFRFSRSVIILRKYPVGNRFAGGVIGYRDFSEGEPLADHVVGEDDGPEDEQCIAPDRDERDDIGLPTS